MQCFAFFFMLNVHYLIFQLKNIAYRSKISNEIYNDALIKIFKFFKIVCQTVFYKQQSGDLKPILIMPFFRNIISLHNLKLSRLAQFHHRKSSFNYSLYSWSVKTLFLQNFGRFCLCVNSLLLITVLISYLVLSVNFFGPITSSKTFSSKQSYAEAYALRQFRSTGGHSTKGNDLSTATTYNVQFSPLDRTYAIVNTTKSTHTKASPSVDVSCILHAFNLVISDALLAFSKEIKHTIQFTVQEEEKKSKDNRMNTSHLVEHFTCQSFEHSYKYLHDLFTSNNTGYMSVMMNDLPLLINAEEPYGSTDLKGYGFGYGSGMSVQCKGANTLISMGAGGGAVSAGESFAGGQDNGGGGGVQIIFQNTNSDLPLARDDVMSIGGGISQNNSQKISLDWDANPTGFYQRLQQLKYLHCQTVDVTGGGGWEGMFEHSSKLKAMISLSFSFHSV
ncbi:hypothetical protein RFI_15015 [Reticulomyxa filosa]|uniref:Uncharacterized protein n=1 Tax=Reticulomyxa filosa TaxID=46433 RepID=X6N8V0_RETFI|nr:hypothetical protein RFI_15015 [Reticulomyxa filosa]|eukprot:ETO22184.1 hypothetical protein RFI_15015 [Reticulomyxa filosa]